MNEYRCTRSAVHRDPEVYCIEAETSQHAYREMRRRFPDEETFFVELWNEKQSTRTPMAIHLLKRRIKQ